MDGRGVLTSVATASRQRGPWEVEDGRGVSTGEGRVDARWTT